MRTATDPLLRYITDRTTPADWRHAHQLARAARRLAYTTRQTGPADDGLPGYLAAAARTVLRRHATRYLNTLTPARPAAAPTVRTLPARPAPLAPVLPQAA